MSWGGVRVLPYKWTSTTVLSTPIRLSVHSGRTDDEPGDDGRTGGTRKVLGPTDSEGRVGTRRTATRVHSVRRPRPDGPRVVTGGARGAGTVGEETPEPTINSQPGPMVGERDSVPETVERSPTHLGLERNPDPPVPERDVGPQKVDTLEIHGTDVSSTLWVVLGGRKGRESGSDPSLVETRVQGWVRC